MEGEQLVVQKPRKRQDLEQVSLLGCVGRVGWGFQVRAGLVNSN